MPYITVMQSRRYHQYSLDELMFGNIDLSTPAEKQAWTATKGNTRTYYVERVNTDMVQRADVPHLIRRLEQFNAQFEPLFSADRESLYKHFEIPKKSGNGKRKIDAPNSELMLALRVLKSIFETEFKTLYHTNAYAYIPGRCTVDAVRKHQQNESRWFLKTDFSNFFGSTTQEFVMQQLGMIFPFSEVMRYPQGKSALEKAISLCFLNGGLPQGTPISPLITNVMMIPIDYKLSNSLRDYDKNKYVYTRYADDIHISSRYDFDYKKIVRHINEILDEYHAPFKIKNDKTHYGSSAGRNWILGVMLNKDNQITLGHQRKKELRARIYNYLTDRSNHIPTPASELYELQGTLSYSNMIEPKWTSAIIAFYNEKMNSDLLEFIKEDIAA